MKTLLTFISILFCLVLLVSCNSRKPLEPDKITETTFVEKIVRDTVFETKADSTFYSAWIECVNGKPQLRENIAPQLEASVPIIGATQPQNNQQKSGLKNPVVNLDENGKLTVGCHKEVERITAQLTSHYEQKLRENVKTEYRDKPFKWYHKGLMWLGGIFLACIAGGIILKFVK